MGLLIHIAEINSYHISYTPHSRVSDLCMHVCPSVCGGQRSVLASSSVVLYLVFLKTGFLTGPKITGLAGWWTSNPKSSSYVYVQSTGMMSMYHHAQLLPGY